MRRTGLQDFTAAFLVAVLAASCGDFDRGATSPSATRPYQRATALAVAPPIATCTTFSALRAQTVQLYGSAWQHGVARLVDFNHYLDIGDIPTAQLRAFEFADDILTRFQSGLLIGTEADARQLVNGVLCYAGLAVQTPDSDNSFVVLPSDAPQTLVSDNGLAGTSLPANPVTEPTLIVIQQIPNTFPAGSGPLDTKLDQYPGFFTFTKLSATNAPFTQPVIVAVCADPSIPAEVRERLRLGHDAQAGFEITPPADASFLQCPTATAQVSSQGLLRRLASLVMPRELHARQEAFFGGVGGTAGEYSDFGPVDPELSFFGGVGGTAGEYLRVLPRRPVEPNGATGLFDGLRGTRDANRTRGSMLLGGCDPVEAPAGSPVADACLPFISVATHLGTPFVGVPVQWTVTAGGGTTAPRPGGVCGAYGPTAATVTSSFGKSGICWTLGAAGMNTVTATPMEGGDAVPGVTFTPATATFNAIANPPVGLVFDQQPPANVTAGAPFTVTAIVVDQHGNQVFGSSDPVTLTVNQPVTAGLRASLVAPITVNAVQGYVTFSGVTITTASAGTTLVITAPFISPPHLPAVSNAFTVAPGAATQMAIVAGNNQTGQAGVPLAVNPTVAVSDQFGNPVPNAAVTWTPTGGTVNPAQSQTNAAGQAATSWSPGAGAVQLTAALVSDPSVSQHFSATGNGDLVVLSVCAPGGSGDPINARNKTHAFYIPNPGLGKTLREIELYLSSNGPANRADEYEIRLTTQMGTFDPAVSAPIATTTSVVLSGRNSEWKPTNFRLTTPIVGTANGPPVMIQLSVLTNPDGGTVSFNTGPCGRGNCNPPPGCTATEVNSLTPYPYGTTYRKGVAMTLRGH